MKAAVVPEMGAAWELREVPAPRPGPGEVLIRVRASGVCYNDVLSTQGTFPFPAYSPAVVGHEPAGEIVEVGAGVTTRKPGDRVGVFWVQGTCGRCEYCDLGLPLSGQAAFRCAAPAVTGFSVPGGHCEFMAVPASGTVPLPEGLSYEAAAPVLCAGNTAWCALRRGNPGPRERVAVLGLGGLGHMAVQFSAAAGLETVAVTRSPEKAGLAYELGAAAVVGSGEELAAAGGADVILATAPSYDAAVDAVSGLRVGGRLVLAAIDHRSAFEIPPERAMLFFAQRHQILGVTHEGPHYLREALGIVADGKVTPKVEVFDAENVAAAVEKVAKGEVRFKAVVTY